MATPPPPPPPEDPFALPEGDPFANGNGEESGSIMQGAPTVAAKPGRILVVLGFVGAVLVLLFYLVLGSGNKNKGNELPKTTIAPKAPEPLPLPSGPGSGQIPPPAFFPPSIPEPAKVPSLKPEDDSAAQKARLARLRSGIMLGGGGSLGGALAGGEDDPAATAGNDPNNAFAAAVIKSNTKAEKVYATRIGDLRRTIAQGRLIQATTESVINTELPAPIRAIVSRDTYAESGTIPLIPKGSRLIGTYNTAVGSGQSRVFIVWTRVIRPDGVDVMINSPGVDQIGQAGLGGQVDSKFQEIFSRSVLASVVGIGFAIGSDKISGGSTTTANGPNGSSTTGDAATTATVNARNRLGSTTDGFLQKLIGVSPSILVDQGTPINVFVNRDLIFPAEFVGARIVE